MPLTISFLWHMHQPDYRDPLTNRPYMPWVRLHAMRGYYDMAKALTTAPEEVSATVNFVPSLVSQLLSLPEEMDNFFLLASKEASALTLKEKCLLLRHFFSVAFETGIRPRPRFASLFEKRAEAKTAAELTQVALRFSNAEFTDLATLFHLAWFGFAAREEFPQLVALEKKGSLFSSAEKQEVLSIGTQIVKRILPAYRALSQEGKVELCTTPYYHPILPLLCDSDSAKRARPDLPLPNRFAYPEDAIWQIENALALHQKAFSETPQGMWPAEGSISPEALALFSNANLKWIASDEGVLANSIDGEFHRDPALLRFWHMEGSSLQIAFRDRVLSDQIGFVYSRLSTKDAIEDFCQRARALEQVMPSGKQGVVFVILDGENPWEHYPDGGKAFLTALYETLANDKTLSCRSIKDALETTSTNPGVLHRLHSGSWIESSFRIWIGNNADNLAWDLLQEARHAIEIAKEKGVSKERIQNALHEIYIAEGSDWFWWYGDDFASEEKGLFDSLFRTRLLGVYRALGQEAPKHFLVPVEDAVSSSSFVLPKSLIAPRLLGRLETFSQWKDAGLLALYTGRATMHPGDSWFERLYFGFDSQNFYVRLDPKPEILKQTQNLRVAFFLKSQQKEQEFWVSRENPAPSRDGMSFGYGAWNEVVEISLPLAILSPEGDNTFSLKILVTQKEQKLASYPNDKPLVLKIPVRP